MKTLTGIAMIFLLGAAAAAQQAPKAVAELTASADKIVKGSPFSADAVSESVQTLADGNRIVHTSTSKLYRNSEGRFRRQTSNGSGGVFGTYYDFGPFTTILDPVMGSKFLLDDKLKTAQQMVLKLAAERATLSGDAARLAEQRIVETKRILETARAGSEADAAKIAAEMKAAGAASPVTVYRTTGDGQTLTGALTAAGPLKGVEAQGMSGTYTMTYPSVPGVPLAVYTTGVHTKYETKSEDLGTQNIEGVEAQGSRTTTIIPAGAVGNERPIEITYERWYSKELQLVVMSKNNDPRSGESTYRLTNIVRNEPDPSLFAVPTSYRIVGLPTPPPRPTAAAVPVKAVTTMAPGPAAKGRPQ